jgi:DNA-binding response OmpR family regulator
MLAQRTLSSSLWAHGTIRLGNSPRLPGERILRHMKILIVDDEEDVRVILRVNLESAGHVVIETEDGDEAIQLAVANDPDAVVLDVMLPRRDGLSVLDELRTHPRLEDVPVVMLSAKAGKSDIQAGLRHGADDYIPKPFEPSAIAPALEEIESMALSERLYRRHRKVQGL